MTTGAALKRGKSSGDLWTPWDFIRAAETKFGHKIAIDLAATKDSAKAPRYITKEENSLVQPWAKMLAGEVGWLNPEFDPVQPWIDKVCLEVNLGARLYLLTRGQIDSNWFWQMEPFASVYALYPRIAFLNQYDKNGNRIPDDKVEAYASPLILSTFNLGPKQPLQRWIWKETKRKGGLSNVSIATSQSQLTLIPQ